MTYVYSFDEPPATSAEKSLLLLGGKGHNLAVMRNQLGLPVPPGFTITTEAGQVYMDRGWPERLDAELEAHMARLEEEVGREFAGSGEPLLVSVRSGAAVSMPGMMDTILNLGLNDRTQDALASACADPEFATDSRTRFESMYRNIVGVDSVPSDPWEQLRGAVAAVFDSWNTPRARSYREREGIADELGTAVTVQAMVFGNLGEDSGTGVMFTRNPATGERAPYGDVLLGAQGEDVVSGTHSTESVEALGKHLPEVAEKLNRHAETLERHFRDLCDIEFTIERARLWLLQVRIGKRSPHAALRIAVDMAEEDDFPLTRQEACERVAQHLANPPAAVTRIGADDERLGTGLPASPGIASGRIATTADSAVAMAEEGHDVILVRPETSPNDVHGMALAKGILTSSGGLASHAAVVARGWGTPAVVGAAAVMVKDGTVTIAGKTLSEGDVLTIDGARGDIFAGTIETETVVSEVAKTLLAWAEELDIEVSPMAETDQKGAAADTTRGDRDITTDDVLRALHIKGFATAEGLAPAVMSSIERLESILEILQGDGLVKPTGEMFQLTPEGKARGEALLDEDRRLWTEDSANRALDDFLPLDGRMKEIVTAWQMKEVDGEQILNDHSDEEYDREVLDRFYRLHEDVSEWLQPLTTELGRMQTYLARLRRSFEEVREGNHTYIASPKIDSYHNAWFELHEDLIQLAGRTREEETRAGRA